MFAAMRAQQNDLCMVRAGAKLALMPVPYWLSLCKLTSVYDKLMTIGRHIPRKHSINASAIASLLLVQFIADSVQVFDDRWLAVAIDLFAQASDRCAKRFQRDSRF